MQGCFCLLMWTSADGSDSEGNAGETPSCTYLFMCSFSSVQKARHTLWRVFSNKNIGGEKQPPFPGNYHKQENTSCYLKILEAMWQCSVTWTMDICGFLGPSAKNESRFTLLPRTPSPTRTWKKHGPKWGSEQGGLPHTERRVSCRPAEAGPDRLSEKWGTWRGTNREASVDFSGGFERQNQKVKAKLPA